jgi:hypothetical protein
MIPSFFILYTPFGLMARDHSIDAQAVTGKDAAPLTFIGMAKK